MADELTNETQGQSPTPEQHASGSAEPETVAAPDASTSSGPTPKPTSSGPVETTGSQVSHATAQTAPGHPGRSERRAQGPARRGGPGGRAGRGDRAFTAEPGDIEDTVVKIYRCATVVKGGRRFSFSALVVAGDRNGRVGVGYGNANEVPGAVEKANKIARRNMVDIQIEGTTIPHQVLGRYGASKVLLIPAGDGTGVIAGASVRAVMELAGVKDVLTKSYGSNSPKNLVKAAFAGLVSLRSKEQISKLREVSIS